MATNFFASSVCQFADEHFDLQARRRLRGLYGQIGLGDAAQDVGSGGGLPGVPLSIVEPQRAVTLLDSNHKKGAFLRQVTIECELRNTQVHVGRAEEWQPAVRFDVAVSRTFSDLAGFAEAARPLVRPGGTLAAMKGVYPDEELALLPTDVTLIVAIPLQVPGLRAARHLVLLRLA